MKQDCLLCTDAVSPGLFGLCVSCYKALAPKYGEAPLDEALWLQFPLDIVTSS